LHLGDEPDQVSGLRELLTGYGIISLSVTRPDINPKRTSEGSSTEPLSWQTAWSEVPLWRNALVAARAKGFAFDVAHAHSFATGMAAVRNFACVVYELKDCVENLLSPSAADAGAGWLRRSFHVAEQFILARAAVVVTHREQVREELLRRGIENENIFLVQPGSPPQQYEAIYRHALSRERTGLQLTPSKPYVPPRYSL
jgi:hypothetical protein